MKIEQKAPEVIQAQVADFAQEGAEDSGRYKGNELGNIFKNIGELAAGAAVDYDYTLEHEKINYHTNERTPYTRDYTIPAADYVAHLRQTRGVNNERVQARAAYLQAYAEFKPVISETVVQLQGDPVGRTNHESFVGRGSNASAFSFDHNGQRFIAKIAHGTTEGARASDERLFDLECGKGVPHLEQLAAISYEDGVAIMERLPGTDLFNTPLEAAQKITSGQLSSAVDTMRAAQKVEIVMDPKASNYMYDPEAGFGFIDYLPQRGGDAYQQTLAQKFQYFVDGLDSVGTPHIHVVKTKQDFLIQAEQDKVRNGLLKKYREVCTAQPDKADFDEAIKEIDKRIAYNKQAIANVETSGWIENHFAEEEARKQHLREQNAQMLRDQEANIPDFV